MKRLFAICLCLIFIFAIAYAEGSIDTYALRMGESYIMVRENGELIVKPNEYDEVFAIPGSEPQFFRASPAYGSPEYVSYKDDETGSVFALMNANGELLTDFKYSQFRHYPEFDLIVFRRNNKGGVMDEAGNELVYGDFTYIIPNGRGCYLATYGGGVINDKLVFVDVGGATRETGIVVGYTPFSGVSEETIIADRIPLSAKIKGVSISGYVDSQGEPVIPAKFDFVRSFSRGYAVVQVPGEQNTYALIDMNGEYALKPEYSDMLYYSLPETPILARHINGNIQVIEKETFKVLKEFPFDKDVWANPRYAGNHIFFIQTENEETYYDKHANVLFSVSKEGTGGASAYYEYEDGEPQRIVYIVASLPQNSEYYLADLHANRISDSYQEITPLSWQNGEGRYRFSTFETDQDDDYASTIYESIRYGLLDENGNVLLPAEFSMLEQLKPGLYWAKRADTYGLIDDTGTWRLTISEYVELMD